MPQAPLLGLPLSGTGKGATSGPFDKGMKTIRARVGKFATTRHSPTSGIPFWNLYCASCVAYPAAVFPIPNSVTQELLVLRARAVGTGRWLLRTETTGVFEFAGLPRLADPVISGTLALMGAVGRANPEWLQRTDQIPRQCRGGLDMLTRASYEAGPLGTSLREAMTCQTLPSLHDPARAARHRLRLPSP